MNIAARFHIIPQPVKQEETLLERQRKLVKEKLGMAKDKVPNITRSTNQPKFNKGHRLEKE